MSKTTESIMTPDPVTCRYDALMNDAAKKMWEHDIGALPVVDEKGRAIGIITDRDIAMAAYTQGKALHEIQVSVAMSANLWAARPQSAVDEVEELMRSHQVRRVPVVDDFGRPVGIVAINDLARLARPSRTAPLTPDDVFNTMRAVCQPRALLAAQ